MQPQTNSIIRAFTLLEILKKRSDAKHKLSQKQLLELMRNKDGSCTEKTLRTDLHNLMQILNPPVSEYDVLRDDFRILYDRIEEKRSRITGVQYIHEFSDDDLELLLELVQTCTEIDDAQRKHIMENLKKLGSGYYTYNTEAFKTIPEYSTLNTNQLRLNIWVLGTAIKQNRRVSFTFNKYDQSGCLVPTRDSRYEEIEYEYLCNIRYTRLL